MDCQTVISEEAGQAGQHCHCVTPELQTSLVSNGAITAFNNTHTHDIPMMLEIVC